MTSQQRIIVNTAAQYTRTIINVCLSLYSTRLILAALGQSDYGIYSVVAGVVSMLSFATHALVVTTQRFLSFNHGAGNKEKVYQIFGNSVLLHLLIAGALLIVFGSLTYPIIHHVLHIDPERLTAATYVYGAAVLMLCLTFITAPFRALFIARENIVFTSIIDVADGILRVLIAVFLTYVAHHDRLITYAFLLIGISVFNLIAFAGYSLFHFEECHIPHLREWNKEYIRNLSGFASWTIYSTGCIIARTQGIAILLNRIFGSVINAAYGIALHVSGAIHFLAQALTNAMSPQIVKAEGAGNRQHMLSLAAIASKNAYLLLSMVSIPLITEMPAILQVWLGEVPEHAVMFCRFVLAASCIDQMTIGLGTANQAVGQIRNYSLFVNTIKVLTLPAAWLFLHFGYPVEAVMWCYIGFEFCCMLARIPFLRKTAGLDVGMYIRTVFLPVILPTIACLATCYTMTVYFHFQFRFIVTLALTALVDVIIIVLFTLSKSEKAMLMNIIQTKLLHKNNTI